MKKLLSAIAVGALVSATVVVSTPDEAWAAATPGSFSIDFSIDCSSQSNFDTSLGLITWPGTSRVQIALIDDQFIITNSDSGGAVCAFDSGTALDSDSAAIANGAPRTVRVANSGAFTLTPNGGVATTFYVDACSLSGSGIESDPWRVGTQADFQKVGLESSSTGAQSCSLAGYYLQTADLAGAEQLDDYDNDEVASSYNRSTDADGFTGTYDGDHYRISLGGTTPAGWNYDGVSLRYALFKGVSGGTIKKVRISGNFISFGAFMGGLVGYLTNGGVVSEVSSSVNIESRASDGTWISVGGIVAETKEGAGRVQYSKSAATIHWNPPNNAVFGRAYIGGIIGSVGPASSDAPREVRDSYSAAVITVDTTSDNHPGRLETSINVGGIVGGQDDEDADFIRTYSVSSASDTCVASCADSSGSGTLRAGGLSGNGRGTEVFVSNFFLSSGLFQAATGGSGPAPTDYDANLLPVAVPLSASQLKAIATYQSKESATSAGDPSGLADLSSDPTAGGESDFRWAIEPITAQTFVPSSYDASGPGVDEGSVAELLDYTNRVDWADTNLSREYRVLRGGVLSAHGGVEAATVVNYPALGRVWDICDNYPTLVWEENNSCTGSGGSSSSSSSSSSTEASANPGGLSDAEYAEYLASGLTLEQFKAARLAATGPDGALLVGGGSLTLLFLAAGAAILVAVSRERRLRRS